MCATLRNAEKILLGYIFFSNILQVTEQSGLFGAPQALYDSTDHVVILNATNIKPTIYGTKNAWVVEFFSSWCGHCIHFAPVYKQFAEEVESWQSVVKVGGIDCADEANIAACRDYEIMGYPSMLFFPPESKEKKIVEEGKEELNRGEPFPRSDKVSQLKHDLMEKVSSHFPGILGKVAFSLDSFNSVWKFVRGSTTFDMDPSLVILIFESETSYVGKELALKLSSYPEVRVLRFHKRNLLFQEFAFKDEWPAVGYLKTDKTNGIITIPKNTDITHFLHDEIMKMAKIERGSSQKPIQGAQIDAAEVADNKLPKDEVKEDNFLEEPAASSTHDSVSLEDLIHAVRNSLRNEVGIFKEVSGTKLDALKAYVQVVSKLFPADRREFIVFLKKLDTWLKAQENEIQINDYLDKLTELELELHPWDIDTNNWGTCKATVPGRRGYTCSLWRLFHTLTILATQKSQQIVVLPVIHDYVKEFFGCSECSKHFTKMVKDEGALTISTSRAQALWLWRAHNSVNLRLKGKESEDPGFPKGLYPSETQCPSCHTSEGSFDEEKVFEYLVNVYTNPIRSMQNPHAKISNSEYDNSRVAHQALQQNHPSRFFSGADYWIFCIVYLSVAALLIFGYLHFKLGSRRSWRLDPLALCRKVVHTSKSMV